MGGAESRVAPAVARGQPGLSGDQALELLPGPALELLISHLSLQEKLLLARLVLGPSAITSAATDRQTAAGRLLRLISTSRQPAAAASVNTAGRQKQQQQHARAAIAAAILHSVHSLTCSLPERGSLRLLAELPQLQALSLRFPDSCKQRRRSFGVSALLHLTCLRQLSITADYSFFWRGPASAAKPALHKQLAATLPQLTTLRELRLSYAFLPGSSGLAGLAALRQLQLLSLDHVLPHITAEAAGQLAGGLTALTSLSINQCFFSSDARRIVQALRPLLPRLQSLGLSRALFPDITPALAQLSGLQELAVSQARLEPADMSVMAAALTQLTKLEAPNNHQLGDAGLLCLSRLSELRHVDVSWRGPLSGSALAALSRLPRLQTLVAKCKALQPSALQELARLTQLQHLDLSGGNLVALGDTGLQALLRLTQLTALHMPAPKDTSRGTDLAAAGRFVAALPRLTALQQLRELDLTRVEGLAPDAALFVTQLRALIWLRMEGWCDCSSCGSGSLAKGCSGAAFQQLVRAALPQLSHFVFWGGCKRNCC